jgi:aminoglycoside 3-N-acetyltransferase
VTSRFPQELAEAYAKIGAYDPDILYVYSDFRSFGRHASEFPDRTAFCDAVLAPLIERGKTLVVSTFTYTAAGRFDVLTTPTRLGVLNKWILGASGVRRSEHPIFSYAALGPQAALVEGIGRSAFGAQSVFDRLRGRKAAFLYIGRPVWMGNTSLHHVEQTCGATYRIHKAFTTEVYRGDRYVGTDYSAFVRRRDVEGESFEFAFREAAERLFEAGLVRQVGNDADLTNVSFHWYDQTIETLTDLFYRDPSIFISSNFVQY